MQQVSEWILNTAETFPNSAKSNFQDFFNSDINSKQFLRTKNSLKTLFIGSEKEQLNFIDQLKKFPIESINELFIHHSNFLYELISQHSYYNTVIAAVLEWVETFPEPLLFKILEGETHDSKKITSRSVLHFICEKGNKDLVQKLAKSLQKISLDKQIQLLTRIYYSDHNASPKKTPLLYLLDHADSSLAEMVFQQLFNKEAAALFLESVNKASLKKIASAVVSLVSTDTQLMDIYTYWNRATDVQNTGVLRVLLLTFPNKFKLPILKSDESTEYTKFCDAYQLSTQYEQKLAIDKISQNLAAASFWRDNKGDTLLHCAIRDGRMDWVTVLLKEKTLRNDRNQAKNLPIHEAILQKNSNLMGLFMAEPHDDWLLPDNLKQSILPWLFMDFDLLKTWFEKAPKIKNGTQKVIECIQSVSLDNKISKVDDENTLQAFFQTDSLPNNSWKDYFNDRAIQKKHAVMYFLTEAFAFGETLTEAEQMTFHVNMIQKILSLSHEKIAQMYLTSYVLMMPLNKIITLLSSNLLEKSKNVREALMSGLVKNSLLTQISLNDCKKLWSLLDGSERKILLKTLIEKSDSTKLSLDWLIFWKEQSSIFSNEELQKLSVIKKDIFVFLLDIERRNDFSDNTQKILLKFLEQETNDDIREHMLLRIGVLITAPAAKQLLSTVFSHHSDSVTKLLMNYQRGMNIPKNSLWYELLKQYCNTETVSDKVLLDFLVDSDADTRKDLITTQLIYIENALTKIQNTELSDDDAKTLSQKLNTRLLTLMAGNTETENDLADRLLGKLIQSGCPIDPLKIAFKSSKKCRKIIDVSIPLLQSGVKVAEDLLSILENDTVTVEDIQSLLIVKFNSEGEDKQNFSFLNESAFRAFSQSAVFLEEQHLIKTIFDLLQSQDATLLVKNRVWLCQRLKAIMQSAHSARELSIFFALQHDSLSEVNQHLSSLRVFLDKPMSAQMIIYILNRCLVNNTGKFEESWQLFELMEHMISNQSLETMQEVFQKLPPEARKHLFEKIISGTTVTSDKIRTASQHVLRLCLSALPDDKEEIEYIRKNLSSYHTELLPEKSLKELAEKVLQQESDLNELSFNGVWIIRLLTSPSFIAACSPKVMSDLIERFRLISLTLKKDEFDNLTRILNAKPKKEQAKEPLDKTKRFLLEKQQRILLFRADDSIRELLKRLEVDAKNINNEKALNVLYQYLRQELQGFNGSFLAQYTHQLYRNICQGDLAPTQNILKRWFANCIRHYNFVQEEVAAINDNFLYNEYGKKVGFLDEHLSAICQVDDKFVRMISLKEFPEGTLLYNKTRTLIGTLNAAGDMTYEGLFQKEISKAMVLSLDIHDMGNEINKDALRFLIQNMLQQGNLESCLESLSGQQLNQILNLTQDVLADTKIFLSEKNILTCLNRQSTLEINHFLKKNHQAHNVPMIIRAVLNQVSSLKDELQITYMSQIVENLSTLIGKHNNLGLLTDIMMNYSDKLWIGCFSEHVFKHPDKFIELFCHMFDRVENNLMTIEQWDKILTNWLNNKDMAALIWKNKKSFKELFKFFGKTHIKTLMDTLSVVGSFDRESAQYKVLRKIVSVNMLTLFPDEELRYKPRDVWFTDDLDALAKWMHYDWNITDNDIEFYQKIWQEMILRMANNGLMRGFYNNQGVLSAEALLRSIQKEDLSQIVKSDLSIPEKERAELEKENILISWRKLKNNTMFPESDESMSSFLFFVMHYSGTTEALKAFFNEVFSISIPAHKKLFMGDLFFLLKSDITTSSIKSLLFHTIEHQLIDNYDSDIRLSIKDMLTKDFFETLAKHLPAELIELPEFKIAEGESAEVGLLKTQLALIHRWGAEQHYMLVHRACQLLTIPNDNSELSQLARRIQIQAAVETELNQDVGKLFYSLIAFFKRLWHYGIESFKEQTHDIRRPEAEPVKRKTLKFSKIIEVDGSVSSVKIHRELSSRGLFSEFQRKAERFKGNDKPESAESLSIFVEEASNLP